MPDLCVGDTVRVTLYLELPEKSDSDDKKAKEKNTSLRRCYYCKTRNQEQIGSTITVRKVAQGVGIEKVLLVNSPWIKDIKVISRAKVRRAKLYYLRERTGKSARLKTRFS